MLQSIRSVRSFRSLIDLTTADRARMPKAGDKSRAFIRKAVDVANEHPQMFPAAFLEEMRKDAQLLDTLSPIALAIQTLAKKLDDTGMQLGAEAFAAARTVYTVSKAPFAQGGSANGHPVSWRNATAAGGRTPEEQPQQTPLRLQRPTAQS